jgi:hypothetical protein
MEPDFAPIPARAESVAAAIIDAAVKGHKALGPGLLNQSMKRAYAANCPNVEFPFVVKSTSRSL